MRREDNVQKRPLTPDEVSFLKDLQKEMNEQDTLAQADPRYWAIMDEKEVYGSQDGYPVIIIDEEEFRSFPQMQKYLQSVAEEVYADRCAVKVEVEDSIFCDVGKASIMVRSEPCGPFEEETCFYEFDEAAEWLEENAGRSATVTTVETVRVLRDSTFFFTNRAAKQHLKENAHHYSDNAYTYAMTAWRNPEAEKLWKILQETDWDMYSEKEETR